MGIPDLGITTLDDVLTDVRRITNVCDTPLLVDADTGFGASAFNIARTVKDLIKAGAAAMHIEDQVGAKRCGHRPNKEIVTKAEMIDRITHQDPETEKAFDALHPMNRMGTVAEVADTMVWITSPQAGFITGQALAVDGGMVAR